MQLTSSKTKAIVNRIGRFSPIVFLRRYLIFFVLIIAFVLTNVLGLWNIRSIDFKLPNKSYADLYTLEESVKEIEGENIFFVSPYDVERIVKDSSGFVKRITVEKRIPSTLHILVEEYSPAFLGYSSDRCVLFSDEGTSIKELCKDCSEECIQYQPIYSSVYISSSSALESNKKLIYSEEVSSILKVLKTFGYDIKSILIEDGISTFGSVNEHIFVFDISDDLDIQLNRMFVVGKKINSENMDFKSLDLRFERPVMKLE